MQIEEQKQQKNKNTNIPWVEKYRPTVIEEVISHDDIIKTIQQFRDAKQMPNLLLYGPPGTGKTSTIIALAKQFYKTSYNQMVLELNASDERGINTVRDTIKSFAESQCISFSKDKSSLSKLIILDEADSMTSAAQFALRRVIEKYSRSTRFCFICNYVSKIIPAIQSRCTKFKFKLIPIDAAVRRIHSIADNENIKLTQDAAEQIFTLCDGDMRRVVNMLQSIALSISIQDKQVNADDVYQFTGMATPQTILEILNILIERRGKIDQVYKQIKGILGVNGISMQLLLKELNQQIMKLDMNKQNRIKIVERMSDIEYRLSLNCNDQIQLLSLIGVFYEL